MLKFKYIIFFILYLNNAFCEITHEYLKRIISNFVIHSTIVQIIYIAVMNTAF